MSVGESGSVNCCCGRVCGRVQLRMCVMHICQACLHIVLVSAVFVFAYQLLYLSAVLPIDVGVANPIDGLVLGIGGRRRRVGMRMCAVDVIFLDSLHRWQECKPREKLKKQM